MVLTREKKHELVEYLRAAGCCERCMLRFLKVYLPASYMNPGSTVDAMTRPSEPPADVSVQTSAALSSTTAASVEATDDVTMPATAVPCDGAPAFAGHGEGEPPGVDSGDSGSEEPAAKYKRTLDGGREAVVVSAVSSVAVGTGDAPVADAESTSAATAGVKLQDASACASEPSSLPLGGSTVCSSCLGVLQDSWIDDMISQVHAQVEKDNYQFNSFTFSVFFPLATLVRERALVASIDDEFRASVDVPQVKEVLKWVASPQLQKGLGVRFKLNSPFQISITVEHAESEQLVSTLVEKCPRLFPGLSKRKTTSAAVNVTSLGKALQVLSDADMKRWYTCPLASPSVPATLSPVSCQHGSIYIGGRYCKYSRELSQTPWIIDGQRKTEDSVQELICNALQEEAVATDVKFCSSGREDVDVRMLGKGRPFCVELVNPKRTVISKERVAELQLVINGANENVQVRDLQMIDKTGVEHMKEGEADKVKHYRALIFVPTGVGSVDLSPLAEMKELVLHQKTPLRVLHRRTLMDRQRSVHSMSTEPVDDDHFHLLLSTQAGTYIKEFVHGDMGRTLPNLGSILNSSVDIVELDVMGVDLDWPPSLT